MIVVVPFRCLSAFCVKYSTESIELDVNELEGAKAGELANTERELRSCSSNASYERTRHEAMQYL